MFDTSFTDNFIERKIVINLITDTDYIKKIRENFNIKYLQSSSARILAKWCLSYYDKYKEAPGNTIESIFLEKVKNGLTASKADDIASILDGLSEEQDQSHDNIEFLKKQTESYFLERGLQMHLEKIKSKIAEGDLAGAEISAKSFISPKAELIHCIDPLNLSADKWEQVFEASLEQMIELPGAMNDFIGEHFTKTGFIVLQGIAKSGKTFMLLELLIKSALAGKNVLFVQCGDMSENEQLMRLAVYLSKRSNKEKYCKKMYVPCLDCLHNQRGTCNKAVRNNTTSIVPASFKRDEWNHGDMVELYHTFPEYEPCTACKNILGSPWIYERPEVDPLTFDEARKYVEKFRKIVKKRGGQFKLATYPNNTLTTAMLNDLVRSLAEQGYGVEVLGLDYADIMGIEPEFVNAGPRQTPENIRFQNLRRLTQELELLLISGTQAAASAYKKKRQDMTDFSNERRKWDHVTAGIGLNQTNCEEELGIIRMNNILAREGKKNSWQDLYILRCLEMGRPHLASYL